LQARARGVHRRNPAHFRRAEKYIQAGGRARPRWAGPVRRRRFSERLFPPKP
jgi:hypothetical protein